MRNTCGRASRDHAVVTYHIIPHRRLLVVKLYLPSLWVELKLSKARKETYRFYVCLASANARNLRYAW